MRIRQLVKNKGFLAATALCVVLVSGVLVFSSKMKKDPDREPFRPPKVVAKPNPSPLNPTTSPNVSKAQDAEVQWLKAQGKYFSWGEEAEPGKLDPAPPVKPVAKQNTNAERDMIRKSLWNFYAGFGKPLGGALSFASAGEAQYPTSGPSPAPPWRLGCPVAGVVVRSTYATTTAETPLMVKVTDPANCAGLPAGTIVLASLKADYSTFRAVATVSSLSLPSGESCQVAGTVLGSDGLPGIGYKVTRNDRKMIGLGAVIAGLSDGVSAARKDSTETTAYEWGYQQTQSKSDNRLEEGILEGGSTFFGKIADGILNEYKQTSPIVVAIPEGLPVEVVLTAADGGRGAPSPAASVVSRPDIPAEG